MRKVMYPSGAYRCPDCGYQAQNRKLLATHVAKEHTENALKCDLCNFITKYQANYWRHRKTLHGVNSINLCDPCKSRFPTKDDLVEHTRQEHPELLDEVLEKVSRPVQNERFDEAVAGSPQDEDEVEEEPAPTSSRDTRKRKVNYNQDEPSIEALLEQGFSEGTKELDAVEANGQLSLKHQRRLQIQRSHLCRDCDFVTKESRQYLIHRKEAHGDRLTIYDCPWCGYASKQLQKLQRHAGSCHTDQGLNAEELRTILKKVAQQSHEAAQLERETNIIRQYLQKHGSPSLKLDQKALVKTIRLPISVSDAESSRPSTPADKKSSPSTGASSKTAACSSQVSSASKTLNQWFTCKKCAFKARSKKVVEDHQRTSHAIESPSKSGLQFKCDICGFSCGDVQKYRQHVSSHGGGAVGDDDLKEEPGRAKSCNKCDFTTTYRWSFDRHVRHHNPLNGPLQCPRCDYNTNQLGSLKFHLSNHHNGTSPEDCEKALEKLATSGGGGSSGGGGISGSGGNTSEANNIVEGCEMMQCAEIEDSMPGEMEGSSIGIDESSQDEDAVTCDLCGACFLNQADLLEHSKREHITEIEAEQAQMFRSASRMSAETSASEETLQRLQNRFGLSITPVAVSGSASTTESKEPVVIELGDGKSLKHLIEGGNTNGSTCSKPLSRSGTIFKCRYCPFSTRVKQEYQKHEAIHKPFVCTLCPYKTVWKNDLSKHMSKSHGEQYEEESPAPPAAPAPPAVSDDSGSQQTTSSTGGVLRNLLSTPDVNQKDSLLFKTLQGSGDSQASPETDSPRQTFNQDEIQNQALKLPANAHYFCPYCDFMTKTASRFHIHYMQHLKVRPFECSVCRIKSNWLWDINKHIRTRVSQGDTSHRGAKCVCINEAGLRDYNKYRCFIKEVSDEGPANGEHIETSDDHGEAGVMATQGQVHPSYSSAEVQMQALAAVQARQQGGSTVPVQNSQEDSQNYMIQQLQKKERASAGALKCGHCDYTCDHKDIMLGHLGAHADVLPFICSKCGLANKWHHTAWIHLQQFHREDQVTLKDIHLRLDYTQNGDVFEMDPNAIVNPQLTVAPNNEVSLIRQLRCSRCPYHTVQKSNMQRHREGHQRARPDLMRYKCPYCDFWQETRRAIQRHMALHPEHIKRGTQGVLDTDKAKELLLNITNNNNNNSPPSEVVSPDGTGQSEDMPRFKCDACPYVTTANAQFIYHKQFHRYNPKAKFKCDKCSYWATHAHLITQHARVHNEGTLDQKFPEGSWLPPAEVAVTTEASESDRIRTFRVMKNGVLIKMHKCRFCPLMNRRKANVRYHELLHNDMGSGKYTCHLCSHRTHSQGILANHMKIHVLEKRRGDSGVELVEEVDEVSSEDDDESATPNRSAAGSHNEARDSRPPAKIKYNCSAVESELFNLLQSRQNGGAIGDDQPAPSSQRSGFQQASPSNGLSKMKKPQKVSPDPYVRRSDGLVTFQSKVNLRKWIACPECPALFMNPTEYNRHLDHHRYGDKYHCSQCSYSMNKYVFVAQHEQVHSEDYMVKKLGYCHRPTTGAGDQKATLVKNVPTSFPTPAVVASSLQNSSPSSQSSSSQVFKISLKPLSPQKRPGPQVALSDEAAANFDNEEFAVSMLIAELHESKAVFEGACSGAFKCSTCPAAFANQGVYRFHQNLHSSPARRLKCHVCTYSVDESGNMMAHAQLHYIKFGGGGNKQTVKRCPKCPATFTKQNFYDGHLLRHGSGERYKCDYCDFATNKSDIISRHRVLHRQVSDELECGLGEENLDANSQISVSTLFRNASVPQTLVEDAAPITLDTALKNSEQNKVEEDKKIYACMACPYTYGRKDGIMHHLKRHVVLQQFDCPHCSFTVSNSATLRDHVKTHFICQKMNKPQAFLHYDEIKIKLDGETIFEDRGKNDGTRFYPDSIPEFREEGPDLLVEYIDPDVVTAVNALLDEICDDKRKMEREVSNSSIYGPIVRRSSSARSSQDEPPAKRSRHSTSTGGESPNSVISGSSTPPPRTTVNLRENPPAPATIAVPSLSSNRELEIVRTKESADVESETELAEINGDASPMEVGDNNTKISAADGDDDDDNKLLPDNHETANTKETAHVKMSEALIVSIGASDKNAEVAAEREANVIDKLVGALQQQVPDAMRGDESKKAENGLHLYNGHNGIDESDRAIHNGETAEAQEERDAKTVLNTIVSQVAQSVLHV